MSNLRNPRTATETARHAGARVLLACALGLCWARGAHAEPDGIEAFVRMVAERKPSYAGPTVPFPEPGVRPADDVFVLCSYQLPVCVHGPRELRPQRVRRALGALETAYAWLAREAWPLPYPDADHGGSNDFDLYLVHGARYAAAGVPDEAVTWSALDAGTSFAEVDLALPDSALDACVFEALAEAALFGEDPAEAELVRRASAAYLGWLAGYGLGCDASSADLQRAPELGLVGARDEHARALALLFTLLSRRHDAASGELLRGLWQATQKHSERPSKLHVAPGVLDALEVVLERSHESLDGAARELALLRYFDPGALGLHEKPRTATAPALSALPAKLPACQPALGTYGSAYLRVPTDGAHDGERLALWLRGEASVRWSLAAVRLDATGRELGRLDAPPRALAQSFLPVELTADTAEVLVVVTELPRKKPDVRAGSVELDDDTYCFQLILDAVAR